MTDASATFDAGYRIRPVADCHRAESSAMILAAADRVAPRRVLILGAGACAEIPLRELAQRFQHVVLNDMDATALEQGLAAADLSAAERAKIDVVTGDLTGQTLALEQTWTDLLDNGLPGQTAGPLAGLAPDAGAAIERLALATAVISQHAGDQVRVDGESLPPALPPFFGERQTFDLVVASCILTQLHAPAVAAARRLFVERFPDGLAQFDTDERWLAAVEALARLQEVALLNRLWPLAVPGGRVYLSESVQACWIEATADDRWFTSGTLRMTRSLNLADYVSPAANVSPAAKVSPQMQIEELARWTWVAALPEPGGKKGRIFDVQALTLQAAGPKA